MEKRTLLEPLKSKYWDNAEFNDFSSPDIVAWKLARSALEHENSLVNHRMTWFFTSQAFLFSAYVLIFLAGSKKELGEFEPLLAPLLAIVGLFGGYLCLVTQDGLNRAFFATARITIQYNRLIITHPPDAIVPPLHYWVIPKFSNAQKIPFATLLLWCFLIFSCVAYSITLLRTELAKLTITHVAYILLLLFVFGIGYSLRGSRFIRKSALESHPSLENPPDDA